MKDKILSVGCFAVFVAVASFAAVNAHRNYTGMLTRVATLEARNAELAAVCEAQGAALERVRADAAAQAGGLARAQAAAAKARAQSEARVQEILTAPIPALVASGADYCTPDGQSPSAAWAGGGAPRAPGFGVAEGQRALVLPGGETVDVDALAAWAAKEAKELGGRLQ